ncbi:MAG: Uncharacterised protein [Methanobacteriota archaeon]|nr:hypothetical protein [Euryarchaeota archaeon]CAI8174789.1 MAG: Uncharacterised protein [Euryarchaeota archaeon]
MSASSLLIQILDTHPPESPHVSFREPETIEEDIALVAQAMEMGIDPFPPKREKKRWGRMALGSFMIVLMVSWTSQFLMRFIP